MRIEVKSVYNLERGTVGSAGFDLRAIMEAPVKLEAGDQHRIDTGVSVKIGEPHVVGLVVPRSGLGSKGLVLGNLVGVIDSDYQGSILVCLWNRGSEAITVNPGDRVAQLLFVNMPYVDFEYVEEFSIKTARGSGGFGHTGI